MMITDIQNTIVNVNKQAGAEVSTPLEIRDLKLEMRENLKSEIRNLKSVICNL